MGTMSRISDCFGEHDLVLDFNNMIAHSALVNWLNHSLSEIGYIKEREIYQCRSFSKKKNGRSTI